MGNYTEICLFPRKIVCTQEISPTVRGVPFYQELGDAQAHTGIMRFGVGMWSVDES
jgi:hypothetical protein